MTMHLVRGMTTTVSNRQKKKGSTKSAALIAEEKKISKLLKRSGYVEKSGYRAEIPNYTTKRAAPTSDYVGNGFKRVEKQYTGNELAGIGTLHKSNMVPIRKDSNDAKEIARMRRG